MEIQPTDPEFVRVWNRVKGENGAPAPAQASGEWEEFLTGKIRAELQRRRDYLALGLSAPARDSLARAKKLSAAWFFRSGTRYLPLTGGHPNRYPNRPEAIRQLYQGERLSEQDYLRAKETCSEEELQLVFDACADACRATCRTLWKIVEG